MPGVRLPVVLFAAFALVAALRASLASPSDWVGSKTCGGCHEAELAAWKRGPHARATSSLGADSKRLACLGCHATGEAPAGRAIEDGVGCEACHGAGAGYAKDDIMRDPPLRSALGLVPLASSSAREPICRRCHQIELRLTPFEADDAWKRLPHGGATERPR